MGRKRRLVERSKEKLSDILSTYRPQENKLRDEVEEQGERNEIIETMRTPGWKYIVENAQRTIEIAEKSIVSTKQLNAYNFMATPFFDDCQDWQNRGIILGVKCFLKSVQLTLNRRYSKKRISLLRGFIAGFRRPFDFARSEKTSKMINKK